MSNINFINLFYENKFFSRKNYETNPTLFLERSGIELKEKQSISKKKDEEFKNIIRDLLEILNKICISIIIFSNQLGIARGLFTWEDYLKFTEEMLSLIHKGNSLIEIYSNGPNQTESPNTWRKLNSAMLKIPQILSILTFQNLY